MRGDQRPFAQELTRSEIAWLPDNLNRCNKGARTDRLSNDLKEPCSVSPSAARWMTGSSALVRPVLGRARTPAKR